MDVHKKPTSLFFYIVVLAVFLRPVLAHEEFIEVIAESKPAVITLDVTRKKYKKNSKKTLKALGESAEFFEDSLNNMPQKGRGSGFIIFNEISDSGRSIMVLTAAHVVLGAVKLKVQFSNGRKESAEIVWINKKNDIALLEVKSKHAPESKLSLSSQSLQEGQFVLSMAGSFDLSVSSSLGIVSAIDVELVNKKGIKLIQTDAVINPGSSGGPLLNSHGQVVGVISNIYTRTGTFSGTAFAVPVETVKSLLVKYDEKRN